MAIAAVQYADVLGSKAHLLLKTYSLSRDVGRPSRSCWFRNLSHTQSSLMLGFSWEITAGRFYDEQRESIRNTKPLSLNKMLGCESNNTSFENYFRLNSSSGHSLQGWKLGPTEAKSKIPADLSRTWLLPKTSFSSPSQTLHLQTFISTIFLAFLSCKKSFCTGHPTANNKMEEI